MSADLRKVSYNGTDIYTCPNGCSESELELGCDQSSFMAVLGKPYKYIRCGACGFGEESGRENPKLDMADVLQAWNSACEDASAREVKA